MILLLLVMLPTTIIIEILISLKTFLNNKVKIQIYTSSRSTFASLSAAIGANNTDDFLVRRKKANARA